MGNRRKFLRPGDTSESLYGKKIQAVRQNVYKQTYTEIILHEFQNNKHTQRGNLGKSFRVSRTRSENP